jgi:5-methyltetrahydropteroyltriglutamate--homocysteine methyltransferase
MERVEKREATRWEGAYSRCHQPRNNIVEHPELVAERIMRLTRLLGRENVIAGTDCGFAQGPFHRRVHPSIMWAKLEALVSGARLASAELWS